MNSNIKKQIFVILGLFFLTLAVNCVFAQETPDYVQEQLDKEIAEKQGNWTRMIWKKIIEKVKQDMKAWFERKTEWVKSHITTPLENKIQEGSGAVRKNLIKIKNFFVRLLKGMGIIRE